MTNEEWKEYQSCGKALALELDIELRIKEILGLHEQTE